MRCSFEGFTIPALATRRVQTQVELESGQSFVIAGLLDNTITESLNKIPGIGDIPLLGKLFQSRARTRNNSELMVLVTPELVRPIPAGAALPDVRMPEAVSAGHRHGRPTNARRRGHRSGPAAAGEERHPARRDAGDREDRRRPPRRCRRPVRPAGAAPGGIR